MDISSMALDRALEKLRRPAKKAKQPSDEERAHAALAHRLEIQKRRRARARAKYRRKKEERAKSG
jgi:hypothetical protein